MNNVYVGALTDASRFINSTIHFQKGNSLAQAQGCTIRHANDTMRSQTVTGDYNGSRLVVSSQPRPWRSNATQRNATYIKAPA
jgi:hypothetical protein